MGICCIKDCGRDTHAKGLCRKHYLRQKRHGVVSEFSRYDKNEVTYDNNNAYIILRDKNELEVARTVIDIEDINKVIPYKWGLQSRKGYVIATYKDKHILLHRLIMGTPPNMLTDHINMDKLDNRKSNLRICSDSGNMQNRVELVTNKSGYKGVYYHKLTGKWAASITSNGKKTHIGLFNDPREAALAYNNAAIKYHGEYARINILLE